MYKLLTINHAWLFLPLSLFFEPQPVTIKVSPNMTDMTTKTIKATKSPVLAAEPSSTLTV